MMKLAVLLVFILLLSEMSSENCVAESSRPVVHHPQQIMTSRYEYLRPPPKRASAGVAATAVAKSPQQEKREEKPYPTMFAEGREGALLPLVPLEQMSDLLRRTCQQWNLVKDRLVCAHWKLSMMTAQGKVKATAANTAKPWPPVLFPGSN